MVNASHVIDVVLGTRGQASAVPAGRERGWRQARALLGGLVTLVEVVIVALAVPLVIIGVCLPIVLVVRLLLEIFYAL